MNLKSIFKNNKLLFRLIISYLLTSILFTSVLMIVVSNFISSSVKDKTRISQKDLMMQSYNTAYYALTDIYGDFYQLWSKDENIIRAINDINIPLGDMSIISQTLDNVVFRDELVDSVYLINKESDLILSNVNTPQGMEDFHDPSGIDLFNDFNDNYDQYKNEIFFPRKASYTLNGVDYDKNYISIVYAVKDQYGKLNSGVMVNIDQNKLSSLINTVDTESSMIIANSNGKIISDSRDMSLVI